MRLGDWKLIEFLEDGHLELYNLRDDIGERKNLARREYARARNLHQTLAEWRRSVEASMPQPNPNYDPARAGEGLAGYEPPTPPV